LLKRGGDKVADWKKSKPRRDWNAPPKKYAGLPPPPKEAVARYVEMLDKIPRPGRVIDWGLREGDQLLVSWLPPYVADGSPQGDIRGCQIAVLRDGKYLLWSARLLMKDPTETYLCAPYLTSKKDVGHFVDLIARLSGYALQVNVEATTSFRAVLVDSGNEVSRRVVRGDELYYSFASRIFTVSRSHMTIDMNLYHPTDSGIIIEARTPYLNAIHHGVALVHLAAEVNGFMPKCVGNNKYVCV